MSFLLALDQGTSSSRSIVFDASGRIVAMAQREFRQIFPHPGWVEHDPMEIWASQRATMLEVMAEAGLQARDIAAIGLEPQDRRARLQRHRLARPTRRACLRRFARTRHGDPGA